MQSIQLNKTGYEPFLDYIKAFAIICVLIGHTFQYLDYIGYGLWAGMQVPLFVLVQSFHSLKKPEVKLNPKKLFWRILAPYILLQIFIITIRGFNSEFSISLITNSITGGGYGPGSYFPWIYLQLAIILKFVRPLFNKGSKTTQTIVALLICELFEVLCSIINLPDWFYRLLAIRYLFLIFLAWIWVKDRIKMSKTNLLLSLLSAASIIYFEYFNVNSEPLFYDTAWSFHRWPCYYYVAFLMCYILYLIYQWIRKYSLLDKFIKLLAKCSYEIFLVQMAACLFIPSIVQTSNKYVNYGLSVSLIFIVSIFGGYLFNILYSKFLKIIK